MLPYGPSKFRSTIVKRFVEADPTDAPTITAHVARAATQITQPIDDIRFAASRQREYEGLVSRVLFEPVQKSETDGFRVNGSRFVDEIKNAGQQDAQ